MMLNMGNLVQRAACRPALWARPLLALCLALLAACTLDPKAASRKYVETGNKYFTREKYKEASIMYRRALQKDLKNPEAYYRLALVDLKERQFSDAARSLQRAVQLDPSNADASAKLADLYFASYLQNPAKRKEELDEVRMISNTLLKHDPKSFDGLRLQAFVSLADHKLPEAIKSFQAADSVKPGQPSLILALCQTMVANQQIPESEALAKQLIASNKSFGPIYDFLYSLYMRTKREPEAEAILKDKIASDPKNGANIAELAAFYFTTGQKDKVTATINHLTDQYKDIPDAFNIAGQFYFRAGAPDLAMAEFQKGESLQPNNRAAYRRDEVQILYAEGKYADAAKLVDTMLKDDPKDSTAVAMRAILRMRSGNAEDIRGAIADLQGVISRSPDSPDIHEIRFNLGRAYLAKYESERASADKTSLLADLDQARIQLEQAIQLARDKANLRFSPASLALAQVYIYRGDSVRATQIISDVISAEPNNLAAYMLRSTAEMNLRKFDEARADLDQVLKARPGDRNASYQLAMVNFLDGKYDVADKQFIALSQAGDARGLLGLIDSKNKQQKYAEAIQIIQSQMKTSKNPNFFLFMLANTEAQAGQFDAAIRDFKTLLASSPNNEDLYVRYAETCLRAGNGAQGISAFEKAHEIAPNDPFPILRLGIIYEGMGRLDEARQQYEAVLKIQPDQPVALNNLAFMKADAGSDLDQALTLAQRATQQAPDDLNVKDTLAFIYTRKGLTDEGLQILRDIVAKSPSNPTFRIHYAMALLQKGDKASAKQQLNAAQDSKPNLDQQRRIKELMTKVS